MKAIFVEFQRHLDMLDVTAEVLALDIARIDNPELDATHYLSVFDHLAHYVRMRLSPEARGRAAAERFLEIVTGDLGFRGNQENYYDPANSLLDKVLDRRVGLPIMLCLVCMAIGRRLGLRVEGLGFPHHFMARYSDAQGAWLLDPFNNVVLELEEAAAHLSRLIRRPLQLAPHFFESVSAVELAARILNNLRAAYTTHPDPQRLLLVLGFQCALEPSQPLVWRERSVLHYHLQHWEEAAHDLRRYFYLLGALPYLFPEEARSVYTLPELATDDRNLLTMHHHIAEILNRIN
jgi:regulator of sirC expression with transglutaminase-like and TPR domain